MQEAPVDDGPCEEPIYYTFRPDNAEELKRCIEEAFANAVYPGDGDCDIIVSGYPDCCGECGETHKLFQGKHWRDIAASGRSLLDFGWSGLAILTPQAWRFYLPAYLLVSLSGDDGAENVLERVLSALTPWHSAGLAALGGGVIDYVKSADDWFAARAFDFSVAQHDCLADFMCAVRDSDPDEKECEALATYWSGRAAEARAVQGAVSDASQPYP